MSVFRHRIEDDHYRAPTSRHRRSSEQLHDYNRPGGVHSDDYDKPKLSRPRIQSWSESAHDRHSHGHECHHGVPQCCEYDGPCTRMARGNMNAPLAHTRSAPESGVKQALSVLAKALTGGGHTGDTSVWYERY